MATRFWVLSNEDSKAPFFRKNYIEKNGGSWSFSPKGGWTWDKGGVKAKTSVKKDVSATETPKVKKRKLFKKDSE